MTSIESAGQVVVEAPEPGPGTWTIDAVHHPRPVTRYWEETHPEPFRRGFAEFTAFYGLLLAELAVAYVDGFAYHQPRPVGEDEFPKRMQRAEEVLRDKAWRDQLRDWDETFKPASIATHRELQAIDPDELSEPELIAYLERCRAHHREMIYQHMRFTGAASVPLGDLLVHSVEWTGLPLSELLEMLRGAAPVSAGASGELEQLIGALRTDAAARVLLESDGDPGATLGALRALGGETGSAVSAYLDLVGYRLLDGFDICNRYALEMPDVLLRAIREAVSRGEDAGPDAGARMDEVRAKVPEEKRAEFDTLLAEALLMYRIRDERGVFSDIWASGIMRRAALAGGRRMASAGRIHDAEHFIDAGFDEMTAMLTGAAEPSADELARRQQHRSSREAKDAPPVLGPPPTPPPDPSGLPPGLARVMKAMGIVMDSMFAPSAEEHEEHMLRGLAASSGVYEGPARRVSGPEDFDRIVAGDVLVTESTTEAFNILLPLLGAIVTDNGGLLSHSAIVAREYGIPGVVGTREGTRRIADGTVVRVDGTSGQVTVRA